jgi:hypothetical protein
MKATQGSKEKAAQEELKNAKAKGVPKTDAELSAIEKIRKLMEFSKENGASESEIENAMKLAQRLMLKHNLEMGDIGLTTNDIAEFHLPNTWKKGTESKRFLWDLLSCIASGYNCEVLSGYSTELGVMAYKIIGFREDREAVAVLFEATLPQVRSLTKARYKESDKSASIVKFTISYQTGFIHGLRAKLKADKEEFIKSESSEEYGLMIVKKDALIEEYVKEELKPKPRKTVSLDVDKEAYTKGKEDGSEKSLKSQLPAAKKTDKKK